VDREFADEHHADWQGQKGYVPMTAGGGCIVSITLSDSADEAHLTAAYGQFAQEVRAVNADDVPNAERLPRPVLFDRGGPHVFSTDS
jgi:hypothetical protein